MAAVLVSAAVLTALGPQAMAAPMPRETSKTATSAPRHVPPRAQAGDGGTVTVLCSGNCYE
ncbi:hypothetical protein [Streptomyces fuscigenes]|uniref:hypothetical protein n=1 Tax=Streptomyces fuscigenes TaxID=1528880 RepID=UPI001F3A2120|nr:hypothetical protein [Streptomyces fuscigenes]MCF3960175.1 hypothetical protein [Streptomyces fuscigenes]